MEYIQHLGSFYVFLGVVAAAAFFDTIEWSSLSGWLMWVGFASGYLIFQPTLAVLAAVVVAYLLSGIWFSIYRYRRFVQDKKRMFEKRLEKEEYPQVVSGVLIHKKEEILYRMRSYAPSVMWPRIAYWIQMWPICIWGNLLKDTLDTIQKSIGDLYQSIWESIVNE